MLVVPAFLVWRRVRESPRHRCAQSMLVLACILALLFPVISATDDLHPIRAEMEESSPSKRIVKQSPGAGPAAWTHVGKTPARPVSGVMFGKGNEAADSVSESLAILPQRVVTGTVWCRPPPSV